MRLKVYVRSDHSEDAAYKCQLQAWDANPDFNFEFDSRGPNVAIDSTDAAVINSRLTTVMKSATTLLVLVGETHTSEWVTWEISWAKENDVKLKLAAVNLLKTNVAPLGLLNVGTNGAASFERDRIVDALKQANVGY